MIMLCDYVGCIYNNYYSPENYSIVSRHLEKTVFVSIDPAMWVVLLILKFVLCICQGRDYLVVKCQLDCVEFCKT